MSATGTGEAFAEHCEVSVTDPLRQGDVLEAKDEAASFWERHLLVLTADCDLAHDKNQGRITCVPLLRADEYLLEMQVPKVRGRIITKAVGTLRQVLNSQGAPNISDDRLRNWPLESEPREIVHELQLKGGEAKKASGALECIRLLNQPASSLDEAVDILLEGILAGPNAPKRENALRTIGEALQGPYSQPPGDALFVSSVAPKHDIGYFAYLRHLEQIWETEIALGPTRGEVKYRRISRMQDRYIHAMVQRFALVFMSIGLPTEYEEIRDLHSEVLGEKYK